MVKKKKVKKLFASIIDNEGQKVDITSNELLDIYKENNSKFAKYYENASIELTGTVERVASNMGGWIYDIVYLDDNWEILFSKGKYDLSELNKGTKIYIKSTIAGRDPENHNNIIAIYGITKNDSENVTFEIVN